MTNKCAFITFIACIESFVGILYAGFCGAILFGKVTKIYTDAMITFSEVCVIRYGKEGIDNEEDDDDYEEEGADDNKDSDGMSSFSSSKNSPFPILVFRIANDLANKDKYGNILNVEISGTVVVESKTLTDLNDKKDALPKKRFYDFELE